MRRRRLRNWTRKDKHQLRQFQRKFAAVATALFAMTLTSGTSHAEVVPLADKQEHSFTVPGGVPAFYLNAGPNPVGGEDIVVDVKGIAYPTVKIVAERTGQVVLEPIATSIKSSDPKCAASEIAQLITVGATGTAEGALKTTVTVSYTELSTAGQTTIERPPIVNTITIPKGGGSASRAITVCMNMP